eukprot:scaffold281_cov282-Ochromonas_danica.AAC.11
MVNMFMARRPRVTTIAEMAERTSKLIQPGRRAVIVGGTSGVGEGIARRLAKAQVSITIVGRNTVRGQAIVKELGELGGSQHDFFRCDAFLMKNVSKVSQELRTKYGKVDYLVLTQGMATIQGRTETSEGLDQKLALHVYSRFLFIRELLPLLRGGLGGGKVMSVLSGGIHEEYKQFEEDFDLLHNYSRENVANAAGFYNDLVLYGLSRQVVNKNIMFFHAAPGIVNSRYGREMPFYMRPFIHGHRAIIGRSIDECGIAMAAPLLEMKGKGFRTIDELGNDDRDVSELVDRENAEYAMNRVYEIIDEALRKPAVSVEDVG